MPEVEYDLDVVVRQVHPNGEIKWQGERIYLAQVLAHEPVGLIRIDEAHWEVRFSFHLLGWLNQRTQRLEPAKHWHGNDLKV